VEVSQDEERMMRLCAGAAIIGALLAARALAVLLTGGM
jgi:hypothetical protein